MSIFGTSQISVSMALMSYSFDLGYIIIISFREKRTTAKVSRVLSLDNLFSKLPFLVFQHYIYALLLIL